ncbi:Coiled stalk of trimeric autotransporter adhesin [Acinetobacter kyonggiensis]|uniref:Coiled stalk of trimeric autotransporter adhesin n=1 Tax=Acinetobacter kyonggiensis TaxID=595670 RepID=A0A1H3I2F5_9GAMM|nr:Coiled stalk of trimeric autotransporter adhesin [Acinetobacter kyonggiensis]
MRRIFRKVLNKLLYHHVDASKDDCKIEQGQMPRIAIQQIHHLGLFAQIKTIKTPKLLLLSIMLALGSSALANAGNSHQSHGNGYGHHPKPHHSSGTKGPKGDTGATGAAGFSAYEIAVNDGYAGTVREWLASLIGDNPYVEIESHQLNTVPKPTATGQGAIAIGTATNVSGGQSIGLGVNNNITGQNSGAIGSNNNVSGNNSYVLGNNVTTAANNSVVLGHGSTSNRDNTVSVGAAGAERQITNVAAGTQDTDAVNVVQMRQANAYINSRVDALNRNMSEFENETYAAVASSLAIASLPQPTEAGYSMLSVGMGTWENKQGFAIGVSGVTENNKFVYKAAATTNTEGNLGGGAAVGWQWK